MLFDNIVYFGFDYVEHKNNSLTYNTLLCNAIFLQTKNTKNIEK